MSNSPPHVGLFVTCLADVFRPEVAFASIQLLERAGCRVSVPATQTCCGQANYNNGDTPGTRAIATSVIHAFTEFDYVVAASGSCISMLKDYPALFPNDEPLQKQAEALAEKSFEITSFLADVVNYQQPRVKFDHSVTYHDSCSGLRHLNVKQQPRKLLEAAGVQIQELPDADVCCGFGGTFCVKYPEISNRMVGEKTQQINATGAQTLLAGDLGCLINMAGKLKREGSKVQTRHVVEVLADYTDLPAIGENIKGEKV